MLEAPVEHVEPARERAFRPVQYLGSKIRLLDAIRSSMDAVDPNRGSMLDVFSGSGVVAAHLAREREVTAIDVQEYARVLASALLAPAGLTARQTEQLLERMRSLRGSLAPALDPVVRAEDAAFASLQAGDPEPLCRIVEHGSLAAHALGEGPANGHLADALAATESLLQPIATPLTLTAYYGGVYFGYRQALTLDCLLAVVRDLTARERDTGLAAILGVASDCVSSVGSHFAQPIRPRDKDGRPKLRALANLVRRRNRDVIETFVARLREYAALPGAAGRARAVRDDYRSYLASHHGRIGAVYADPPYTRDHYSRFYHVLETIAQGDVPELSTVNVAGGTSLSRGLYRRQRHQSPFCIRSEAPGAFRSLFEAVRELECPLVLSYSPYTNGTAARPRPRLLTIEEIVDLACAEFGSVRVETPARISHSKFNALHLNGEAEPVAELFVICSP